MSRNHFILALGVALCLVQNCAADLLIETESFDERGGWVLDTQFIDNMGSPYLLAHGMGRPVKNAVTTAKLDSVGTYHVYVRTMAWAERWNKGNQWTAQQSPGRFQVAIDGSPLAETLGDQGEDWQWEYAGTFSCESQDLKIELVDLTGFDGRCDAIWIAKDKGSVPPNGTQELKAWRLKQLKLEADLKRTAKYDLVVIGGGYSGMGAAISAARMGSKVALIQNRPVLGGNGSSEVRVWANGLIKRGRYPKIGEIVEEFADKATKSPGTKEEFGDDVKEEIIRAEANIDLFLNHHAYDVAFEKLDSKPRSDEHAKILSKLVNGERKITSVSAFDTRSGQRIQFKGKNFADCTGHGTIGHLAGADWEMTPKGRMGMSNMWRWANENEPVKFPSTPWALELEMKDFPYPRDFHGQWFWESGFDKDPIGDAEGIRDWNLRAVYGAFNAMKNKDGREKHLNASLTWVAFIGGPRESRRLLGDVVLTQKDVVEKKQFNDGCVPSTWSIDLHYAKKQYAKKFPNNPFISMAEFDKRVDREFGYPVPYRCFYSRNVTNLFMAGRNISVTHEALGTTRVMKTCGMMGEVVGKAAAIAARRDCTPREVYERYWPEMDELLRLPGAARPSSKPVGDDSDEE